MGDTGSVVRSGRRTWPQFSSIYVAPATRCGLRWEPGAELSYCHREDMFVWGYKYNLLKLLPSYCMRGCGCICWSLEIWIFLGSSQLEGKRVREEIHYRCKQNRKGKGWRCIWMDVISEEYCIMSFIQLQKNLNTQN